MMKERSSDTMNIKNTLSAEDVIRDVCVGEKWREMSVACASDSLHLALFRINFQI